MDIKADDEDDADQTHTRFDATSAQLEWRYNRDTKSGRGTIMHHATTHINIHRACVTPLTKSLWHTSQTLD